MVDRTRTSEISEFALASETNFGLLMFYIMDEFFDCHSWTESLFSLWSVWREHDRSHDRGSTTSDLKHRTIEVYMLKTVRNLVYHNLWYCCVVMHHFRLSI